MSGSMNTDAQLTAIAILERSMTPGFLDDGDPETESLFEGITTASDYLGALITTMAIAFAAVTDDDPDDAKEYLQLMRSVVLHHVAAR